MKTILVVDDDGTFVKNVSEILANGGFRVLRAADGAEALRILEREHTSIDAVIVDLNLPQVSGFEVIGALTRRKNPIGIMATTGIYRETYLEVARYLGAHIAVPKPAAGSNFDGWLDAVRSVIKAEGEISTASEALE